MVRSARRGSLRIAALVLVVALPVGGALAYRWLRGLAEEFERLQVAVDFNAVRWNDCVAARWYARLTTGSRSTKRLFSGCRAAENDLVDAIVRLEDPDATEADREAIRDRLRAGALKGLAVRRGPTQPIADR